MSKPIILGLVAAKGAGKDTLAAILAKFGFTRLAFADALYKEAADAYGVTVESMQVRETKELRQDRLSPAHCFNEEFTRYCLRYLEEEGRTRLGTHEPMSPREVLQQWGTFRRIDEPEYWLKQVEKTLRSPDAAGRRYVITDVRFSNEADRVEAIGGALVRIRRKVAEDAAASDTHPSETELRNRETQLTAMNDGTLEDLELEAGRLVSSLQLAQEAAA